MTEPHFIGYPFGTSKKRLCLSLWLIQDSNWKGRVLWKLFGGLATILQNWISCNEQKMREAHITRRGTSFYLLIFIEKIINRKIEHSQSKSLLPVESSTAACSGNARSITSGSGKPRWGAMQERRALIFFSLRATTHTRATARNTACMMLRSTTKTDSAAPYVFPYKVMASPS